MKQNDVNKQQITMKQPARILIADDHPRSRNGLQALLATSPEVTVVGEAADGQEAVRLVEKTQPDVVLMDIQMPVMDGLQATQQIKSHWPEVKVIALTMYGATRPKALAAGVDGFLIKGCSAEELLGIILGTANLGGVSTQ
jgi:DNA-binding NarL/FixJ family response regulator